MSASTGSDLVGTLTLTGSRAVARRLPEQLRSARLGTSGPDRSGVLVVRRLALASDSAAGVWTALGAGVDAATGDAARPVRGRVPSAAGSVLFRDEAELLACALADPGTASSPSSWWRRHLAVDGPAGLIAGHPRWAPSAFGYLSDWGRAEQVLGRVTPEQAGQAVAALCEEHRMPAPGPVRGQAPAPVEVLRAVLEALLERSGHARRAPGTPTPPRDHRGPDHEHRPAGAARCRAPTSPDPAIPAAASPAERSARSRSTPASRPDDEVRPASSPPPGRSPARSSARPPDPAPPADPDAGPATPATRSGPVHRAGGYTVAGPGAPRPASRTTPVRPAPERAPRGAGARRTARESAGTPAGGQAPPDRPGPAWQLPRDSTPALASDGEVRRFTTGFAGVLYLLNPLRRLDLPTSLGVTGSVWRFLAELGRLLQPDLVDDALWPELVRLAGRDDGSSLGSAVVPEHWPGERAAPAPGGPGAPAVAATAAYLLAELGAPPEHLSVILTTPGRVTVTATRVDVDLAAGAVDLLARRRGLDADPGWYPEAGLVIGFHFGEDRVGPWVG